MIVMTKQQRTHFKFSVNQFEQMIKTGILGENDPVELIRGEILNKMTIGERHAASVKRLNRLFNRILWSQAVVGVQDPVRLINSRPEPDISLLAPRDDFYESSLPTSVNIHLIIEVADSSLDSDRHDKGPAYAESGITEYWIVNLVDDTIEVYREPQADGSWGETRLLHRGERIEVAALPGVSIAVDEVL